LNKEIKKIADEWKQELDAKNYSAADINRNKLIEKGIV
jgi:cysteinyl-tRNA synthetase